MSLPGVLQHLQVLDGYDGLESRRGGTDGLLDALGLWLESHATTTGTGP